MAVARTQLAIFVIKRLVSSVFVLLLVSFVIFVFVRAIPGDPVRTLLGDEGSTPEQYEALKRELGLDRPLLVQYAKWGGRILQGNFGTSMRTSEPVLPQIIEKLKATAELAFASVLVGSILGILAGLISAVKRDTLFDSFSIVLSMVGMSMPVFWLGLLLIIAFSVKLDWLPISGMLSMDTQVQTITGFTLFDAAISGNIAAVKDILKHLLLPALALGFHPAALTARTTRASMLEVIHEDYIHAGLARGLHYWEVLGRHAFRNALIPVVTVIGLQIGTYLGGSIVTETVFSWPGLGRYVVTGIYDHDYTVVQGSVLVFTLIIVAVNLCVDLLYRVIDPRVKL